MTLAQRVRDYRYAKGWGPDELASRAEISRTALYQIESGKTEQPRAATLRRIAAALCIPTENLLGQANGLGTMSVAGNPTTENSIAGVRAAVLEDIDERAVSLSLSSTSSHLPSNQGWSLLNREVEVGRKLHELLRSPLGESVARIVEETHRLLPARFDAIR